MGVPGNHSSGHWYHCYLPIMVEGLFPAPVDCLGGKKFSIRRYPGDTGKGQAGTERTLAYPLGLVDTGCGV